MVSQRTAKSRGSAAERELLHKLYAEGWGAVRAAGSGSIPLEVPDVIAGHMNRTIAVEIKLCSGTRQYLKDQEIADLKEFCMRFGCEGWIGVKFLRRGWHFQRVHDIKSSGKMFVLSIEEAKEKALSFEQLIS